MTAAEISSWIGGGAGLGGLAVAAVALIRARPESKKLRAETTKIVGDTYAALVASLNAQVGQMRADLADLAEKHKQREEREDRQERLLLVHERWDLAIAEQVRQLGGHVGDPPPLYPDSTAA